jgi:peptidoglycan hydrolase-like protein with peptidoglycan-binding domain
MRKTVLAVAVVATSVIAAGAQATVADRKRPDPNVAGLQTALALKRLYHGPIDGIAGPKTAAAVRALQRRAQLADASAGGRGLYAALGRLGRRTRRERSAAG